MFEPEFAKRESVRGLEEFSHIWLIWQFSENPPTSSLTVRPPRLGGNARMGVFATRSPARPNPIAMTASEVINIDLANGIIRIAFIDADDDTPVLDIKPYTPSFDRVEAPGVPAWSRGWPKSTEASGDFDWGQVFNF